MKIVDGGENISKWFSSHTITMRPFSFTLFLNKKLRLLIQFFFFKISINTTFKSLRVFLKLYTKVKGNNDCCPYSNGNKLF